MKPSCATATAGLEAQRGGTTAAATLEAQPDVPRDLPRGRIKRLHEILQPAFRASPLEPDQGRDARSGQKHGKEVVLEVVASVHGGPCLARGRWEQRRSKRMTPWAGAIGGASRCAQAGGEWA